MGTHKRPPSVVGPSGVAPKLRVGIARRDRRKARQSGARSHQGLGVPCHRCTPELQWEKNHDVIYWKKGVPRPFESTPCRARMLFVLGLQNQHQNQNPSRASSTRPNEPHGNRTEPNRTNHRPPVQSFFVGTRVTVTLSVFTSGRLDSLSRQIPVHYAIETGSLRRLHLCIVQSLRTLAHS
jgi:hypothetical protein